MNICRQCKWAVWEMTKHKPPRISAFFGRCDYPPSAAKQLVPYSYQGRVLYADRRIDPVQTLETCTGFEKKGEENV